MERLSGEGDVSVNARTPSAQAADDPFRVFEGCPDFAGSAVVAVQIMRMRLKT
jgi:hypothetical protein